MKTKERKASSADRYVSVGDDGLWEIRKAGHRRATAFAESEVAALKSARALVAYDGGGRVLVLNSTGKIAHAEVVAR